MTETMIVVAIALAVIGIIAMVRGAKKPTRPLTDEQKIEAREHARRARAMAIVNDDTTHFWSK